MKILTVTHDYPPHRYIGAELYDHALHRALVRAGHTAQVHTTQNSTEPYTLEGVAVNHPITTDYDLIICHVDAYQEAHHVRRVHNLRHVPIVGIQHNFSEWTLKDEAFYDFAGLIYNSQYMMEHSRNKTSNKAVLIPPAAKPSTLTTSGEYVMIVGTTRQKGVGLFYKLAQNLPEEQFLGVAGGWGSNHQLDYPNVTFVEQTRNLRPHYLKAKALLVPSQFESWSMAASEAMGYGVPVVTYDDLPGVEENVDGVARYVARDAHWSAWRDAINNPMPADLIKQQALNNYRRHQAQLKQTVKWLESLAT